MLKHTKNNKRLTIEIIVSITLILVIALSTLTDLKLLNIPRFFYARINNIDELLIALFSVQASVATLSIAIVSIITGVINDTHLGMSVSAYITNIRPRFLKHKILIISNLIITLINYFSLSYDLGNLSIALFTASIILAIMLVEEICIVFLGKQHLKNEIHKYILNNYSQEILKNISADIQSAIESESHTTLKDDYTILKDILKKEISNINCRSEIIEQISQIAVDTLEKIALLHNPSYSNTLLLFVCDLYEIANSQMDRPQYLSIWEEGMRDIISTLGDLSFKQHRDSFTYYKLHSLIYRNLIGEDETRIKRCQLKYFSSFLYDRLIIASKKTDPTNSEYIKKRIYENIYWGTSAYESNTALKEVALEELCYLHKKLIDSGDSSTLTNFYFNRILTFHSESEIILFVVTLLYLYYLAYREPLVENKTLQKYALEIIEQNKSEINNLHHYLDLLKITDKHITLIKDLLGSWEYMEELKVKTLIAEDIVDDFFIFTSLKIFWRKENLVSLIQKVVPSEKFSIYTRYFSKDNFEYLKELYSQFNKMLGMQQNNINDELLLLKDTLNQLYKEEILERGQKYAISESDIDNMVKQIMSHANSILDNHFTQFKFNEEYADEKEINFIKNYIISDITLPYSAFSDNTFERYISDNIFSCIINVFLRSILKHTAYQKIKYDDRNKQETLINMVKSLCISPNVVIGNREEFWDEEDKALLKKFTEKMHRIDYPYGHNNYFVLDKELIEFAFENVEVKCNTLSLSDIEDKYKMSNDGALLFNVTNDLYIPFEEAELKQYIDNTYRKFSLTADIKFRLHADKVGAGITITV